MDLFDKIGKKASEAYKATADKTGKLAKEAKIKMKMNELKSEIEDLYNEIGKKVYEKHVLDENINIKSDLEEECIKIDVLSAEIDNNLKECLELKDKKQCEKCFIQIDKEANFCPNCGSKQEKEPAKEVEIINDDTENIQETEEDKQETLNEDQ